MRVLCACAGLPCSFLLTCWLEQVWKLIAGQRAAPSDLKQHDAHSSALLERIATCDEATFESSVCAAGPLFFTFDGSDGVYVAVSLAHL